MNNISKINLATKVTKEPTTTPIVNIVIFPPIYHTTVYLKKGEGAVAQLRGWGWCRWPS